jgi:hypothetical protein
MAGIPSIWFGSLPVSTVLARARDARDGQLWNILQDIQEQKRKLDHEQEHVQQQQTNVQGQYEQFVRKISEAKQVYEQMMSEVQAKHDAILDQIHILHDMAKDTRSYVETMRSEWKQEVEKYDEWIKDAQVTCPLEHVHPADGELDFVVVTQQSPPAQSPSTQSQSPPAPHAQSPSTQSQSPPAQHVQLHSPSTQSQSPPAQHVQLHPAQLLPVQNVPSVIINK